MSHSDLMAHAELLFRENADLKKTMVEMQRYRETERQGVERGKATIMAQREKIERLELDAWIARKILKRG